MIRRRFLSSAGAVAAALLAWPSWAIGADRSARRLLAVLNRPASARAVGHAYLADHPHEADADRLLAALAGDLRRDGCDPERAGRPVLREALACRIRRDFARGRVVRVDGWVLSLSEARLCALAALCTA